MLSSEQELKSILDLPTLAEISPLKSFCFSEFPEQEKLIFVSKSYSRQTFKVQKPEMNLPMIFVNIGNSFTLTPSQG